MKKTVNTYITKQLYVLLCREKERLKLKEKLKKGKKRKITMINACDSIYYKLLK